MYNKDHFYHKFIKGIFSYFKLAFEENYLYQFVPKEFLKNLNSSKDYYESQPKIYKSLVNMLNDMNRVIIKESNNFDNSDNIKHEDSTINKMPRNKYRLYAMTYQPHTYEEILKIYDESTSDDEIVLKIDALIDNNKDDDDYLMLMLLKDNIENYIRCKEMEKKLKQIENFKEQIIKDNAEIYFINKKLKNNEKEKDKDKEEKEKEKEKKEKEKEKKEKQKKEIAEMKSEINKLKNKVNILEQKVNLMEQW